MQQGSLVLTKNFIAPLNCHRYQMYSSELYCLYVKITFGIPFADFTPEPRHCCEGFTFCSGVLGTWYLLGITLVLCVVVVVAYQQSSVRTSELLELNELV